MALAGLNPSSRLTTGNPSQAKSSQRLHSVTPVRTQLATFKGRKEVRLLCKEGQRSAQDYLKQVERVVRITFQDPARVEHIGDSTWRAQLTSVPFFSMSATPVCDVKVIYDEASKVLKINSQHMCLELSGGPDVDISFSLEGELMVTPAAAAAAARAAPQEYSYSKIQTNTEDCKFFEGSVALGLVFSVPLPFSLLPERSVNMVGDVAVEIILGSIERDLCEGIIQDYNAWCTEDQV